MTPQRPLPDGPASAGRVPIPARSAAVLASMALALGAMTTGTSGRSADIQDPSPQVFRSAVNLVEVDAVVTIPDGMPIPRSTCA